MWAAPPHRPRHSAPTCVLLPGGSHSPTTPAHPSRPAVTEPPVCVRSRISACRTRPAALALGPVTCPPRVPQCGPALSRLLEHMGGWRAQCCAEGPAQPHLARSCPLCCRAASSGTRRGPVLACEKGWSGAGSALWFVLRGSPGAASAAGWARSRVDGTEVHGARACAPCARAQGGQDCGARGPVTGPGHPGSRSRPWSSWSLGRTRSGGGGHVWQGVSW